MFLSNTGVNYAVAQYHFPEESSPGFRHSRNYIFFNRLSHSCKT